MQVYKQWKVRQGLSERKTNESNKKQKKKEKEKQKQQP